jgi:NADH-quinone oxidoreductase subunit A
MLGFAVAAAVAIVFLSHIIGRRKKNPVKQDFYECGVPPLTSRRMRFQIRFYVIAMLFIVFDFEAVCLLPWAVSYRSLLDIFSGVEFGWAVPLLEVLVFIGILLVGYLYVLRKGALEWE